MSSLKRKKNDRIFIEKKDVIVELNYNYKKFNKIDKKVIELVEKKTQSVIVNTVSKEVYKGLLIFLQTVSSDGYCSSLDENYIKYYFNYCDAIISLHTFENEFIGYCMFSFSKDDIVAHLICGNKNYKNVGTIILDTLKELVEVLEFGRVVLKSTTEALPFYLKRGYECINEECPMELIVRKRTINLKNSKNTTIKKKKTNNTDK